MAEAPVVSIVARSSGMGKTTVMERLIAGLNRRGWRVGAVKNSAVDVQLDYPGKDSWRYDQAGARAIAILTPGRHAVIQKTGARTRPEDAAGLLQDVDIILVEGYRNGNTPKIEVVRAETGQDLIASHQELVAVVTDMPCLEASVPLFGFDGIDELAGFVEERFLRRETVQRRVAGEYLTHFDEKGQTRMVDVTGKENTSREATARGEISMDRKTLELVKTGRMAKGDVLAVAQVAAVMGVKETSRLIPLCHPLMIGGVLVEFKVDEEAGKIEAEVTVKLTGQTGVEMEALTGVSTALLTIYDMCKAVDRNMVVGNVRLLEKKGGRSGHFMRRDQ